MLCSSLFPLVDSLLCGEAAATLQENPLEWETEASCQQPCEFTIPEGILQPQSSLQMTAASADLLIGTTQQTLNHSHSAKPLLNSCPAENLTFFFFYYGVRLGSKFLFIPQVCPTLWAPFIEQLSYLHWIALGPLLKISWSVGFTPGMPEYVNIRTSISVVHHSDRMKEKKKTIISCTSHHTHKMRKSIWQIPVHFMTKKKKKTS